MRRWLTDLAERTGNQNFRRAAEALSKDPVRHKILHSRSGPKEKRDVGALIAMAVLRLRGDARSDYDAAKQVAGLISSDTYVATTVERLRKKYRREKSNILKIAGVVVEVAPLVPAILEAGAKITILVEKARTSMLQAATAFRAFREQTLRLGDQLRRLGKSPERK